MKNTTCTHPHHIFINDVIGIRKIDLNNLKKYIIACKAKIN